MLRGNSCVELFQEIKKQSRLCSYTYLDFQRKMHDISVIVGLLIFPKSPNNFLFSYSK